MVGITVFQMPKRSNEHLSELLSSIKLPQKRLIKIFFQYRKRKRDVWKGQVLNLI